MAKYLVKITATATDDNPSFAGETRTYYYGKGETEKDNLTLETFAVMYGYKTAQTAKMSWIYRNPNLERYWNNEAEIIAVEV